MSNKERITQLEAALEAANTIINQQKEEIEKLKASTPAPAPTVSKSRQQAEAAFALLQKGPVTLDMLKEINPKYPSDPVYFVRTILKQTVSTTKVSGGKTFYSLPTAVPVEEKKEEEKKEEQPAPVEQPAAA